MSEMDRKGFTDRQVRLNRATSSNGALFEQHRRRIMDLALRAEGGTAAVLGAGNCNDVDLPALASRFEEVHLVDLDAEALRGATLRQPEEVRAKLVPHGGADVSGILERLAAWDRRAPSPADIDAAVTAASEAALPASGLGLCLSSCLLTQMILSVVDRLGERHPRVVDVVRALRTGHLLAMARSLRRDGLGVLVSDMVSSDTVPGLHAVPARALGGQMVALVRARNFFTGANPFLIADTLKTHPQITPLVRDVVLCEPWLWQIGPERWYLVFAVQFRRSAVRGTGS
jgi:hypothetical protein